MMTEVVKIGAFFDGTANHKDNDEGIGDGSQTNIAKLVDAYQGEAKYVEGIGTRELTSEQLEAVKAGDAEKEDFYSTPEMAVAQSAWLGKNQVVAKAEKMLDKIKDVLEANPNAIIEVDTFGFSRGAASARHFVNKMNELYSDNPKVVMNFVGLMDTVASVGTADEDNGEALLDLDENAANKVVQISAGDELRENFKQESLKNKDGSLASNHEELTLKGRHADIGGGYKSTEHEFIVSSRNSFTYTDNEDRENQLLALSWEAQDGGMAVQEIQYGSSTDMLESRPTSTYAIGERRQISNDLADVALQLMINKAKQSGSQFNNISSNTSPQLQDYMNDVLAGRDLSKYDNDPELARYIHTSHADDKLDAGVADHLAHDKDKDGERDIYYNNDDHDPSNDEKEGNGDGADNENIQSPPYPINTPSEAMIANYVDSIAKAWAAIYSNQYANESWAREVDGVTAEGELDIGAVVDNTIATTNSSFAAINNQGDTDRGNAEQTQNSQQTNRSTVANALVTEALMGASDPIYSTISDRLGNGYLVTDGNAVKIGDGVGQISQTDADAEIARRIAEREAASSGGGEGGGSESGGSEGGGSEGGGSGGGGGGGGGGDGNGKPVVLDLDGDGVELVRLNDSPAYYDIFGDDYYYQMGWVGADDGFLAFDIGRDGVIEAHNELSFVSYVEGAQTDLQGLAYFDSNNDGLLDSNDAQWDQFGIWQDKDQDAITDWDEYNTLSNLGITSISLTSDGQQTTLAGNQVFGFGTYTTTSGQQKALADVGLSVGNGVQLDTYEGFTIKGQSGHQYWFDDQNQTSTTVASDTRYQGYFTQDGNDILIIGHAQDVMVDGGTGDDTLTGGDGDDIIMGSAGSDTLAGGAGNDVLLWDENDKNINGNAGYDTALFTGSDTANLQVNMHTQSLEAVYTKGGDDTITAVGKTERVYIEAAAGNDTITGGLGNDTLSGGEGRDQLIGGAGDDILHGGMHADWLDAGAGDDHLYFDAFDTMVLGGVLGGAGTDTGYFDAQGQENTSINLTKSSLEVLYGDTSSDLVTAHLKTEAILVYANDGADIILGGLGDDIIHGEAGTDVLNGGAGADQLSGGEGNDEITFDSADTLVDGGDGYDTGILQSVSGETVTVNLHDLNLERVFSQAGNDTLNASELQQAANLQAGAGADTLTGSQYNDLLRGDDGNDVLTGGLGSDQLQGGQGNDTLYFDISDSLVDGGEGIDIGHLNANNEQHINFDLTKASVEILHSDTSGDLLTAFNHTQAVTIYANDGADYVEGSDHDDQLFGEAGHDTLKGGAGADKLDGGAGNDTLYFDQQDTQVQGGEGYDVGFMQSQANTVASIDLQKTSLERLIAGDANDLITARDKNQAVIASGGNGQDYLEGTKHDDVLNGDAGHDTLKGGAGADTLNGGAGLR